MTMTDPGMDVIRAEPATNMVLAGATPEEILHNASQIADALKGLIEAQGLSVSMGRDSKHVEVGGWQAAGAMLGALGGTPLHAETVWSRRVDRDDAIVYESRCEVRTLAGEVAGAAESLCSSEERNWRGSDEFAIKGMAETRAESRAYRRAIGWVIKLAGYSPTPAEEMRAEAQPAEAKLPDWAAPMSNVAVVAGNLTYILQAAGIENTSDVVSAIGDDIFKRTGGEFPFIAARVLHLLKQAVEPPTVHPPEADEETAVDGTADEDTTTTKEGSE